MTYKVEITNGNPHESIVYKTESIDDIMNSVQTKLRWMQQYECIKIKVDKQ